MFRAKGSDGNISIRHRIVHNVHLSYDDGSTDFSGVSDVEVITAPGLPIINRSVYRYGNIIIPYLVCRGKNPKETGSRARWVVECDYETDGQVEPQVQQLKESVAEIPPKITRSVEVIDQIAFKDRQGKPYALPTGTNFSEPGVYPVGCTILNVSQYEDGITDDDLEARIRTVNKDQFRSKDPYSWVIESIDSDPATVPLIGGDHETNEVSYTLKHNPLPHGWRDTRGLVDTHHMYPLASGGKVKVVFNDGGKHWIKGWENTGDDQNPVWEPGGERQSVQDGLLFEQYEFLEEIPWPFLAAVDSA